MILTPRYVLLALVLLTCISACKLPFGNGPDPSSEAAERIKGIEQAHVDGDPSTVLALADGLETYRGEPRTMVRLHAITLLSAASMGRSEVVRAHAEALDEALDKFDVETRQTAKPDDDQQALSLAEDALRTAQLWAYDQWLGGRSVETRDLLQLLSESYRAHFPDALLGAEVLWAEAEFIRMSGKAVDAVPLYEIIEVKDFQGTYRERARERVIQIWTDASASAKFPTDLTDRMDIPSPHAEWIAIARRAIAAAPESPVSRQRLIRIAEIQLAYKQIDEGHGTLRGVIADAEDEAAVDAARTLLTHVANNSKSSRDFRVVRKELQSNKFLWKQKEFRLFLNQLKKQVEGK